VLPASSLPFAASLEDPEGMLAAYVDDAKPRFFLFTNGDLIQRIDGINMPQLLKAVSNQIPEGLLDDDESLSMLEDERDLS
jgi:hypothetical protein